MTPPIGKEVLIKSGAHIAPSDFSSDCMKATQEYCMYFKELECKMTENLQARCVPSRQTGFDQCFLYYTILISRCTVQIFDLS